MNSSNIVDWRVLNGNSEKQNVTLSVHVKKHRKLDNDSYKSNKNGKLLRRPFNETCADFGSYRRFTEAFTHIESQIDQIYKNLTRSAAFPLGGTAYLSVENTEVSLVKLIHARSTVAHSELGALP
jgi:hypothetical protein